MAKAIGKLGVPGHGHLLAGARVSIDVVPCAVTVEVASRGLKFADEILAFHTWTSTSTAPGGAGSSSAIII